MVIYIKKIVKVSINITRKLTTYNLILHNQYLKSIEYKIKIKM